MARWRNESERLVEMREGELRTPTQSHVFISNATRVLYYRFEFLLMSRSNYFFNILFNVRNALSPVNDSITL